MSLLRPSLVLLALFTVLCGLVYPLAVTALAQAAFPHQANGSLVERGGAIVGSELIGQPFSAPGYFWSRPSATTPAYNGAKSSGSNLGPLNPVLHIAVAERVKALRAANPESAGPVPVDLVTASGSGLDPHVSPAAAFFQARRVAKARGVDVSRVRALIESCVEERLLGVLGERSVNVLLLNLALDRVLPQRR